MVAWQLPPSYGVETALAVAPDEGRDRSSRAISICRGERQPRAGAPLRLPPRTPRMPKDLPGLYWDAARNRYFPESSRPKTAPPPPATLASTHQKVVARPALAATANPRRWHPPLHSTVRGLSTESYTTRLRDRQ